VWLIRALILFALGMTVFAAVSSRELHSSELGRRVAVSDYVALEADGLRAGQPALARQLAVAAYRIAPTAAAASELLDLTGGLMPAKLARGPHPTGVLATVPNPPARELPAARLALARARAITPLERSLLSPTGRLLVAAGANGLIYLWSLTDPHNPQLVATVSGPSTAVTGLALNADAGTLAVATRSGEIWLYAVGALGQATLEATITGAGHNLTEIAFSANNQALLTGRGHRRWYFRAYQSAARICTLDGNALGPSQWALYVPALPYRPPCPAP
jgi:hypothetical protein